MSSVTIDDLGTILGVWAHPDDEVYLSGGLMAAARDHGNRVVCVTATLGEHGTPDPARWPPERLGPTRAVELRASLAALGVIEHRQLGYPDGGCADVPFDEAVARIAAIADEVRPDTVLTFGPDGFTGHPDHRTVSAWVSAACAGRRILHARSTSELIDRFQHIYDRIDVFLDDDVPVRTPIADCYLHLPLDGMHADRKLAALRAQATQTAGVVAMLGEDTMRDWVSAEAFVAAEQVVEGQVASLRAA